MGNLSKRELITLLENDFKNIFLPKPDLSSEKIEQGTISNEQETQKRNRIQDTKELIDYWVLTTQIMKDTFIIAFLYINKRSYTCIVGRKDSCYGTT